MTHVRDVLNTTAITLLSASSVFAQGGEDSSRATVITELPFFDPGTTNGYLDDSDEVCPYTGSTSPDVYYQYTPRQNEFIDIGLCDSGYDTKLYVYDSSLGLIACSDDACSDAAGNPFRSHLPSVELVGGEDYFIVVDGWNGDFGDYLLQMMLSADQCPFGPPFPGATTAVELDGVDDYIDVADASDLRFSGGQPITIETWIRAEPAAVFGNVMTKASDINTNYALRYTSAGQIHFFYRNMSQTAWYQYSTADGTLPIGSWHHLAVSHVFGTTPIEVYVDGILIEGAWGADPAEGPLVTNEPLFLGASANNPGEGPDPNRFAKGLLREMRLWSVARSQPEIQASMALALNGDEPGLTALWPLDEGTGAVATDIAGDHDGLILGAGWRALLDCGCPADINGSSAVDFGDLLLILSNWGPCPGCGADLDGSAAVDFADLLLVLSNWGPCPEPTGACCLVEGACREVTEVDCSAMGGSFDGLGATCAAVACPGPNGPIVTAPFAWTGDTCLDDNDCDLRLSLDVRWQVTIPTDGDWTLSVCTAGWDTWLAVGTTPCSLDVAFNDDTPACGGASEITATLAAGTYYVTLEGFASGDCGPFTLTVLAGP